MRTRAMGGVAVGLLVCVSLACGLGGDGVREALDELAPRYAPLRENLTRAVAALPPPGSVTANTCSVLQPPPRFDEYGHPVAGFVWTDVHHLSGDTEAVQFALTEPRLIDCLLATEGDPEQRHRWYFSDAADVRRSCGTLPELVLAVRTIAYTEAEVNSAGTEFTPGTLDLEAFAIQPTTGAVVCQLRTVARNGSTLDFNFRGADKRERALQAAANDLRSNAGDALRRALLAPPPPTVLPPPPARWQQDTLAPLAYAVPPGWVRVDTTNDAMLVRWQQPLSGSTLPTFYVERRPNDHGSIEQLGEEAAAALTAAELRVVQRRSVQDGGGHEWVELESIRPEAGELVTFHNWTRMAASRDGQHLLSVGCGAPEALIAELGPACQAILGTVIARE